MLLAFSILGPLPLLPSDGLMMPFLRPLQPSLLPLPRLLLLQLRCLMSMGSGCTTCCCCLAPYV